MFSNIFQACFLFLPFQHHFLNLLHPILLHLFQAVYNDDGQFQGPGVRSQVPWFRTLPLQDHSGIPGGLFGISAIKSITPFLPEKQDHSPSNQITTRL